MISNAQKAVLHVAKQRLAIEDEDWRALLRSEAGVTSSVDLDAAGFDRVMKRLERLGFTSSAKAQRRQRRQYRPNDVMTAQQQTLIRELYGELGWTVVERQMGFNRRACGMSWPQTRTQANKVIEGLKAMLARARNAATAASPERSE